MNGFKLLFFLVYLLLSINCYSKSHEFNNIVVFGDSLSDIGNYSFITTNNKLLNSKMVAGNGFIYNEYLSKIFTGKNIEPSNISEGSNHAYTNSLIIPISNEQTVDTSVVSIFNKFILNNKIHSDALYVLWAGGNDVPNNLINLPLYILDTSIDYVINIFLPPEEKIYEDYKKTNHFMEATKYMASMAYNLNINGSKYIIVNNLFDISLVPQFLFAFQNMVNIISASILDVRKQNKLLRTRYLLPFNLNIKIYNFIRKLIDIHTQLEYYYLNKNNNIPKSNAQNSGNLFIRNIQNNINNQYGVLGNIFSKISEYISYLNLNFNYFLEEELYNKNINIIYMDIYSLYNEIIDNPKFYGIDDILLQTCSGFKDSNDLDCKNKKEGIYHSEKTYLWSDYVHPSGFMHKVIAQYMISVFNAPVLVSSISRHLASINSNNEDYINNHLFNLNHNENINKLITFVSITGSIAKIGEPYDYDSKNTNTTSLNIGFTYDINFKLLIGAMLSSSYGSYRPYDNFRYRYNSHIISLFSKYSINDNWWLNTIFDIGRIGAGNIRRTIKLGKGKHIEKGSTNGSSLGLNFNAGYDFDYKNDIILTPYISLNIHNYRVSGFKEEDYKSSSMRYANSSTTYKDIKLSFRATKQNDTLSSFLELGIIQPIHNQPIKIKSGLKNTKISFVREIEDNKKTSLNLALGFNKTFNNNISINTSLNYKINKYKNQQLIYSLGFKYNF